MAKKRHQRRAPEPRVPSAPKPAPAPPPPAVKPSWWFDFSIDRHHLALFRLLFFGVLAVDAFLQIGQAPRYGAGAFNVPQISWLPLPAPSRELMLGVDVLLAYLCTLAALGVATRLVVPLAAALDAYGYFSSQLDSYQHHYLVVMLLVCAAFVPWEDPSPRVKSWALRLFTVQVAILYGWAAFAKLDDRWIDGTALNVQLTEAWIRDLLDVIPVSVMAKGVLLGEILLAVAWLWRRSWPWALPLGLAFHVGVELAGFQIGQFSYVMIAVYVLMLPERWAVIPARRIVLGDRVPALAMIGVGVAAGIAGWWLIPLPIGWWVILLITAIAIGEYARRARWQVGAAHLFAWLWITTLALTTDEALDYHKFWAGSSRRLGQTEEMRRAYQGLLHIDPDHGPANYYLGTLALADGHPDVALRHFKRAQRSQPKAARGWTGEAQAQRALGNVEAAVAAERHAAVLGPEEPR